MNLTLRTYLIIFPLAFLAAVVDSIGGGGGLISLPAYTLAGLPYGTASGCNKFSSMFGSVAATVRFIRSGKIKWKPVICAIVGAIPGSWLGTRISLLLSNRTMSIFMICAIPVIAVFIVLKKDAAVKERPITKKTLFLCLLTGFGVGAYDGFFGPGAGTFLILLFNAFTGMDMVSASATAKPVNLVSNLSSLVTRIFAGQVVYALAVPATVCSIAGGWIGSRLALTRGAKFIRYVMLFVLALLIIKLIADLF